MLNAKLFTNDVLQASKKHAEAEFPKESVGFVVDNEYVPVKNSHKDPEHHFKVSPTVIAKYGNKIQAIIHSHNVTVNPETGKPVHDPFPSYNDMVTQISWNIPFGIQLINDAGSGNILWWGYEDKDIPPLEGRPYIHGVYDCFSLLRDYFRVECNIHLPDFPRHDSWWDRDDCPNNLYLDHVEQYAYKIDVKDLQQHDVVLLCIRSKVPNHAVVYEGGDVGIHHLTFAASKRESMSRFIDPQRPLFHSAWRLKEFKE